MPSRSAAPDKPPPLFPTPPETIQPGTIHIFQQGHRNERYLALAACTILVYDYILTFRDELKHSWRGKWTLTRVLFLFIRYSPFAVMIITLDTMFQLELGFQGCTAHSRATFILSLVVLTIGQATLVLRVYHLYSFAPRVQWAVVIAFAITFAMVITLSGLAYHSIVAINAPEHGIGCETLPSDQLWKTFLPQVIMDSIIFAMTVLRAFWRQNPGFNNPVMTRLVSEGGIYFAVVLATIGVCGIGTTARSSFGILFPAVYSNLLLTIISISTAHLLLSIHSLAGSLSTDPDWLLNNIEVDRLALRYNLRNYSSGAPDILVNIDRRNEDDEHEHERWARSEWEGEGGEDGRWPRPVSSLRRATTPVEIMMTRVGVYERDERVPHTPTDGSVLDHEF